MMANAWRAESPWQNLRRDGDEGASPGEAFAPDRYDLSGKRLGVDASDFSSLPDRVDAQHVGCAPRNPRVAAPPAAPAGQGRGYIDAHIGSRCTCATTPRVVRRS